MPGFPGFILTKQGEALLAKVQSGGTLNFTKVSTGSGKMPTDNNVFSAIAAGDLVTVTNSEKGVAAAADVDTGFTVTEVTPGDAATAEVTSVQCLAASTLVGGEYFTLSSPYLDFYILFTVDGVGVDPEPAGKIRILVDLAAADSAVAVAGKLATALDHHRLDMSDLMSLINPQQDIAIQSVSVVDAVTCEIKAILSNSGLATGYYLCELGLFATDPDIGEILYFVSNADDNGDSWPAEGAASVVETDLTLLTTITAAAAVTMTVDLTIPATKEELADHDADLTAHPEMRQHGALKDAVRVATTGDIVLNGEQAIDGVAVVDGDAVLVKNQADGKENGIYLAAVGAWTRREDVDAAAKLIARMLVPVKEGTVNGGSVWWLVTEGVIVLETTALVFEQPFPFLGGSAAQLFKAAPGVADDEVVVKGQAATEADTGLIKLATDAIVQAGLDTEMAVTSAGLASFAKVLSGNGYVKLPGGLIVQWAKGVAAAGGSIINWPIAFPNAVLTVIPGSWPQNAWIHVEAWNETLTQFSVQAVGVGSHGSVVGNYVVLAIGH